MMGIAENVATTKAVREFMELFEDFEPCHWERLRDILLAEYPLPVDDQKTVTVTDQEVIEFGHTYMPFGQYSNATIDNVPLGYLEWLCREQEDFYRRMRAYMRSKRISREIDQLDEKENQ